ncbi:MAG TPA: urea ABC transporter ATP-binding protein UrtD [Acetobacteraceae bacterium]|jgi:urea transport system ATP-binding protein|nr:urea ABC transporter ATP-binding protein UrtD [Acetobacteraceae bacterium]
MDNVLSIRSLTVEFSGFKAVDSLNLDIARGEIRVVIGANGAGKTTLMDAISGKASASQGQILFNSADITNWPEHRIARAGIGRKFQIPSIFKNLSVRQNYQVALSQEPRVLHNVFRRPRDTARIEDVLNLVGLTGSADEPAGNLSHGQTQWMELGMVLVQDPALILLDEPTAGMTVAETSRTADIINRLHGRHTILVVEHDMAFVRSICRTITVMHMGRKLAEGPVEEIENHPAVREAYLGSGGIGHA